MTTATDSAMLRIDDVSFGYRKGHKALRHLSASFGPGIHLLLGPNGAGKTTLLKIIAGLLRPSHGACLMGREATNYHSPHAIKDIFLLTDGLPYPLATINELARLHAPFYSRFSPDMLGEALWAFGMTGNEPLAQLSTGNRHKAQTAYALALGTRVLLLDEPAEGLDITSKKTLARLLGRAAELPGGEERCIIVATHTVQEMRNLFDSVTVIDHGRAVLNAPVGLVAERLAFVRDAAPRPDALCFEAAVDGPTQIVPNDGTMETPIDFPLLFTAAVGPMSDKLKSLLA